MTHYASAGVRTPKIEALSLTQKVATIFTGVTIPKPQNANTPKDKGLSYETRSISVDEGGYLEAWYVPHDDPKGIILMFPGYAESKDSLLGPAMLLHELGYDLLMVDFRGAGGSSGHNTTLGVREAEDVARVVEYTESEWPGRQVVLHGVSMGAAAILRSVAKEGVQPTAIILESPFDRMLNTVRNRFHAMGLPAFPAAELLVTWGSVQQGSNGFENNPVGYAEAVQCPTLLMHGELDPRVTGEEAHEIYEHLGGQKQFVTFPGAGHQMLANFDPDEWKAQVEQFLSASNKQ